VLVHLAPERGDVVARHIPEILGGLSRPLRAV
jgi:hypothetical protein